MKDAPKGVIVFVTVYRIIVTVKANGVNYYTYLEYVVLYIPDTEWKAYPTF